ncbi:MAG: glycosyltransferase [Planctomycetes bacterium]|nr:glycosyltransferase [Planctomycetota bacterium]
MQKVLFILPSLKPGGAERVFCSLLQSINRADYELELLLIHPESENEYKLPAHIQVHRLNVEKVSRSIYKLLKYIRFKEPDCVYSTMAHLNMALLLISPFFPHKCRLYIREASVSSHNIKSEPYPRFMSFLYPKLYPWAEGIVCQSSYMKMDLCDQYNVAEEMCHVIPNPLLNQEKTGGGEVPPPLAMDALENEGPHLLSVARLDPVKRHIDVIRSLPEWLKNYPLLHYWLLGDGPEEETLKAEVNHLGLNERVHFMGYERDVIPWLKKADLFIHCSLYEGFPNALLEAVAHGCPVLVRDHPGGTRELMTTVGLLKRLVPDLSLCDEFLEKPPESSRERVREHYGVAKILKQYDELFAL